MGSMQVLSNEQETQQLIDGLAASVKGVMSMEGGPWAIVGIRRRGDVIAGWLAEELKPDYTGTVDITLYRDDLSEIGAQPIVRTTEIDFPVDGTNILLVDDVLMSGRSVRAAIQSIIDFGRPKCIKLLVLVDRGGRELPIAADFAGRHIEAGSGQHVEVSVDEGERSAEIVMYDKSEKRK